MVGPSAVQHDGYRRLGRVWGEPQSQCAACCSLIKPIVVLKNNRMLQLSCSRHGELHVLESEFSWGYSETRVTVAVGTKYGQKPMAVQAHSVGEAE